MGRTAQRTRARGRQRGNSAGGRRPGELRVIGGRWRGRKLPVADLPGLRPTGNRIRETLFNWLAPDIAGARCLDLFAGTGALGIEALSRGALRCDFVEAGSEAAGMLKRNLEALDATDVAEVHHGDALDFPSASGAFDIVFLDPPFDADLWDSALAQLLRKRALAPDALLYIERPAERDAIPLPGTAGHFEAHREGRAGAVAFGLWRYHP